jgi:hypothetical protein
MLVNKQKREGKYRKPLKTKSMCQSRNISFWKDKRMQKNNAQTPKDFDRLVVT